MAQSMSCVLLWFSSLCLPFQGQLTSGREGGREGEGGVEGVH
jgi:hypothetical protein